MKLQDIIAALGAEMQGQEPEIDEDGVYHLEVNGQPLSITEVAEADQAVVWSRVGDLPPEGREALYRMILEAMAPGGDADGLILSVESESQSIYLHGLDELESLDAAAFGARLVAFADFLGRWKSLVGDFRPSEDSSESTGDEDITPVSGLMGGFMQV